MLVSGSGAGVRAHEAEREDGRTSHTSLGSSMFVCECVWRSEGVCPIRGGAQVEPLAGILPGFFVFSVFS